MTDIDRLYRLLALAVARGDIAAQRIVQARIDAAWRASARGRAL